MHQCYVSRSPARGKAVPTGGLQPVAIATTLLRVALGTMFLAHSVVLKLLTFGLPGTAAFFRSVGLPGWLGYVTFAAEAVGGTLLILGVQTRYVALALSPLLLGAIVTVHLKNGWLFEAPGGGWEYPAYLFVLCVAQGLLGDGLFALSPSGELPFGRSRVVQADHGSFAGVAR